MKYPYNLFLGSSLADLFKSKNMVRLNTRAYSACIYQHNHRTPLPADGSVLKVLLVVLNPYKTLAKALELSEEARLIGQGVQMATDSVQIIKGFVRTESDLIELLATHRPQMLHFVGGSDLGGLELVQGNDNHPRALSWVQVADIFERISEYCSAVFFHAYIPDAQLDGICQAMPIVLGVDSANANPDARQLIAAFYKNLSEQQSITQAFSAALNTMQIWEDSIEPTLQYVQIANANIELQYSCGDVWIQEIVEWDTFIQKTSLRVDGHLNPRLVQLGFELLACIESYCNHPLYQKALMCAVKGNTLGALDILANWDTGTNMVWLRSAKHLQANLYGCLEQFDICESILQELIEFDNTWENYYSLALLYQYQERWERSRAVLEQALSIPLLTWRQQAKTYILLGCVYEQGGQWEHAIEFYEETLAIQREQVLCNKDVILPYLSRLLHSLGVLHQKINLFEKSENYFKESLQLAQVLIHVSPRWYAADLAKTLNSTGNLFYRRDEFETAEAYYRESLALYRILTRWDSTNFLANTATTLNNLAGLLGYKNLCDENIVPFYEEALSMRRQLAERNAERFLPDVATTLNNLATVLVDMQQQQRAEGYLEEALSIRRKAAEYNQQLYLPRVAVTLHNLANLYSDLGKIEEANNAYEEALQLRQLLAKEMPRTYEPELGITYVNYSEHILNTLRDTQRAYDTLQKGLNLMIPKYGNLPFVKRYLAVANSILMRIHGK